MTEPTKARRGRPRTSAVLERDEAVYQALLNNGGSATREKLIDVLGFNPTHIYLSLKRLRSDGYARRVQADNGITQTHMWEAIIKDQPQEEPPHQTTEDHLNQPEQTMHTHNLFSAI